VAASLIRRDRGSFDHPVRPDQDRSGNGDAEGPRGFHVHDQREAVGPLYRKAPRARALQDLSNHHAALPIQLYQIRPVRDETTVVRKERERHDDGQTVLRREVHELPAVGIAIRARDMRSGQIYLSREEPGSAS